MCNRYGLKIPITELIQVINEEAGRIIRPAAEALPNLEPREDIFPTERAPIIREIDGGLELVDLRWGLIPWFHKGTIKEWKFLTTNARAEGLATNKTYGQAFAKRRCLIPMSHYFEWTGEKGKKTKWRFTVPDIDLFCVAGIWDVAHTADGWLESYSLVTAAASPAVRDYHNRQPLILQRGNWTQWLAGEAKAEAIRAAVPDDSLNIEVVLVGERHG